MSAQSAVTSIPNGWESARRAIPGALLRRKQFLLGQPAGKSQRHGIKSGAIDSLASIGEEVCSPKRLKDISTDDELRTGTGLSQCLTAFWAADLWQALLFSWEATRGHRQEPTILLQICRHIGQTQKVLYVSGEESLRQIKLRADRLGVEGDNLKIYSETNMENILERISREKPDLLVIDPRVSNRVQPERQFRPGQRFPNPRGRFNSYACRKDIFDCHLFGGARYQGGLYCRPQGFGTHC